MSDQSIEFQVRDAATKALGAGAFRCRFSGFAVSELPADNVLPDTETVDTDTTDDIELKTRFTVVHLVAVSDDADAVADQRYVRGARLLLADKTLGGLVRDLNLVNRRWHMEKAELQQMSIVATYEVSYSTTRSDPSVAGY